MTSKELIQKFQKEQGLSKGAAEKAAKGVFAALADALQTEDRVQIPGVGVFKAKIKPARQVRRPMDGAMIDVPERRVVTFKPTKVS